MDHILSQTRRNVGHLMSPQNPLSRRRCVGLFLLYVFAGLLLGGLQKLIAFPFFFNIGPSLQDPVTREHVMTLTWVARGLWIAGGMILIAAFWQRSERRGTTRGTFTAWRLFLVFAVMWFGFSLWVVRETRSAAHASEEVQTANTPWFVTNSAPNTDTGSAFIFYNDAGLQPQDLTIPASVPVKLQFNNGGSSAHSFVIDELDIHEDVPAFAHFLLNVVTVSIDAPPGDYRYYCDLPGHEGETGGILHAVAPTPVAELVFDGERLSPDRVTIPAGELVTIRVTNASSVEFQGLLVRIPGIASTTSSLSSVRFWVEYGATTELTLSLPPGEWRFWGWSSYDWKARGLFGDVSGNVPGGTLVAVADESPP